jgi:hypothetical protein
VGVDDGAGRLGHGAFRVATCIELVSYRRGYLRRQPALGAIRTIIARLGLNAYTRAVDPQDDTIARRELIMDLNPAQARRRRRLPRWFAVALGASAVCGLVLVSSASGDPGAHKVTLCHATASSTNPYASVTVDYHSVLDHGHGGHEGPVFDPFAQGGWGDVIPAFDFGPDARYPGMNLNAIGQNILTNGCQTNPVPTTSSSTSTPEG